MSDEKRRRRRRGRRGGQNRQGEGAAQPPRETPQNASPAGESPSARAPRRDTRRGRNGAPPEGPPSPSSPGIRRAPSAAEHPEGRRRDRDRPRAPREQRDGRERQRRDGGMRMLEAPPPQDEQSIALGKEFREAQGAMRDARKAIDKRRAEFNDEPDWMLAQLADAERRFEEASTAWVEHLSGTGRKMARR